MIRHKLFSKGEYINVLITNNRYSNIVFPVKAIIHDIEFNDKMPRYQIRIVKFYDDIDFLKRYMFEDHLNQPTWKLIHEKLIDDERVKEEVA